MLAPCREGGKEGSIAATSENIGSQSPRRHVHPKKQTRPKMRICCKKGERTPRLACEHPVADMYYTCGSPGRHVQAGRHGTDAAQGLSALYERVAILCISPWPAPLPRPAPRGGDFPAVALRAAPL